MKKSFWSNITDEFKSEHNIRWLVFAYFIVIVRLDVSWSILALFGLPLCVLFYFVGRRALKEKNIRIKMVKQDPLYKDFLDQDELRSYIYKEDLFEEFSLWKKEVSKDSNEP